jgi:hypothetical protein
MSNTRVTAAASLSEALPAAATNPLPITPTLMGLWAGNRAVKDEPALLPAGSTLD